MLFQLTLVLLSFNSAWLVHGKKCSGINRLSKDHQLVAGEDHTGDYSSSETPSSSEVATTSEASSASVPVVTETDDPTEDASESEHSNGGNSTGDFYTSGSLDMFSKRLLLDFSDVKEGEDASAKLAEGDFSMTTYTIGDGSDGTIPRQHMEENVKLGDGVLLMTTQAYSGSGNVKASEITTDESFLYASARVVLKSTDVEGVCIGHFFYGGGPPAQEVDIEILTSSAVKAAGKLPEGVWFSNHPLESDKKAITEHTLFGFDPSKDFHEYRIDWTPGLTVFYVDGEEKNRFTENVPTEKINLFINNWSDGNPNWSQGPPTEDATIAIKQIEVLYGYEE